MEPSIIIVQVPESRRVELLPMTLETAISLAEFINERDQRFLARLTPLGERAWMVVTDSCP
jgi:hypothetical protein